MRDRIAEIIGSESEFESYYAKADAILALEVGNKPCESDGMIYTSMPPQYKCKHCGKFWRKSERAPSCKRPVTIQDLIGA